MKSSCIEWDRSQKSNKWVLDSSTRFLLLLFHLCQSKRLGPQKSSVKLPAALARDEIQTNTAQVRIYRQIHPSCSTEAAEPQVFLFVMLSAACREKEKKKKASSPVVNMCELLAVHRFWIFFWFLDAYGLSGYLQS